MNINTDSIIPEFQPFAKIPRLSRRCVITEKLDGTNSQVYIDDSGLVLAGSRNRWIFPNDDNFGFAAWVEGNKQELLKLGPGRHFGEWWGRGIQRNYGIKDKRWSLFNVDRWCEYGQRPRQIPTGDPRIEKFQEVLPECVSVVPTIFDGPFDTSLCQDAVDSLRANGSLAAPGFDRPEGIIIYHTAAGICFKKTLEKDEQPKNFNP